MQRGATTWASLIRIGAVPDQEIRKVSEVIATFRLTSIRWFSKGQKCNLDLTAGASHAR
jgi:hypothetical protein